MAWSPLAGGELFNPTSAVVEKLNLVASKYNISLAQLALAWLLKHPNKIIPILGTQNIKRLEESVKSNSVDLTLQDWFYILELVNGVPIP